MASAAASAIVASTVGAQTADSRARQSGATPDASGGDLFSALLAQLLQGPQSSQDAAQLSADLSQEGVGDASATTDASQTGATASASSGGQAKWLADLYAALTQQSQQSAGGQSASTQIAALTQLLQSQNPQGTPGANAPTKTGTQKPATPSPDASLLAALQSLAAQPPGTTTTQPAAPASSATSNTVSSPTTPPNAQLAAMLQTLQAEQAAMTGAPAQDAAAATASQTPATPAANAAASATPSAASSPATQAGAAAPTAAQHAQFSQATQSALHQGATTPVTEAQSLPLHFDLGSGGSNGSPQGQTGGQGSGQTGGHSQATNTAQNTQSQSGSSVDTNSANSGVPAFIQALHDQNASQQTPTTSTANSDAANTIAATAPSQPAPQQTVATLQVGPSAPTSSPTPNVHALAVSIATQSQAGNKQFDIRLDPPELGRVDVRLTVDAAGKAQAHLAVDKPQTLELLQKDSGSLARALKDAGVQLNNNGLQFSLKGQNRQGNGSQGQSRSRALSVTAVTTTAPAGTTASSSYSVSTSGVDIRV